MPESEDHAEPTVHAEGDSVAVGGISTGDIHGPLVIGRDNKVTIYASSEEDAPLTSAQIENGLKKLNELLPERAPVLLEPFADIARKLRATLGPDLNALSPALKRQREEQLDEVKELCREAADISFHALGIGQNPPPYQARCPFRGLESFRPEDHKFFFGREELTRNLVRKIQANPCLAVLGASGSGKSSLVMAGLIPALGLDYHVFCPGTNPLEALQRAEGKPLIVVDQFEELFTLTNDKKTRNDFIDRLLDASKRSKVVITMRFDFLGELRDQAALRSRFLNEPEIVLPMSTAELQLAMEAQASQVGLCFDEDLSNQILEDVEGEPGAMPLLQHALWELWKRRHGRNLRAREYRDFGGVKQAISRTAEEVFGKCTSAEQEQVRNIFLKLTRLDDQKEGRDTRRRVPITDLNPSGQSTDAMGLLLDKLANARLIVKTPNGDTTEVEVAHEALIEHWVRLRNWINENRSDLLLQRQLEEAASSWDLSGRDANDLYRGKRLSQALQWANTNSSIMASRVTEFLNASRASRNRERRALILRWGSLSIGALSILTVLGFALIFGVRSITNWLNQSAYRPLPMEWVEVPGGEFRMGSETGMPDESPVHLIHVDSFEIGKYEVTNEQYLQCVTAQACTAPRNNVFRSAELADHPVSSVSWVDAVTFCRWMDPEKGRLPTEAEWEKAARGTDERIYPWGDEIEPTYANYDGVGTSAVGSYPKDVSPHGAYDMAGNVWEWVADKYAGYDPLLQADQPPSYLDDGSVRTIRGGSWYRNDFYARATARLWADPKLSFEIGGFRCARAITP